MPATQQIINYGATANDGTGDPLRDAFIKTDENFSNIWSAGPVGSNITIANNTISVQNTNGNLILMPNGVGAIQARNAIMPWINGVYDLGSSNNYWRKAFVTSMDISTLEVDNDLTVNGNLTVMGNVIEMGSIVTDALTIQLANSAVNPMQADGAGITVGANNNIATFLYDSTTDQWQTNVLISSDSLAAAGANRFIQFNDNGKFNATANLKYDKSINRFLSNAIVRVNNVPLQITTSDLANVANVFSQWTISGNVITSPSGATWVSNREFQTEYISSSINGYIDIHSLLDGNIKSDLMIEHGKIRIRVNNGESHDWEFNEDGTMYFPHFSFPNTTPANNQILISNDTGNLNWTTILVNEIFNGTSNVSIPEPNGSITFSVNGTSNVMVVSETAVNIGTDTPVPGANLQIAGTDSILVPVGNTDQRPAGVTGMVRFNTSLDTLEFYDSDSWTAAKTEFTVVTAEKFNGDGSTLEYMLSMPSTTSGTVISINGIVQEPDEAYSVSGTSLLFTEAPGPLDIIDVRILTTTVSVGQLSNSGGNAVISVDPMAAEVNITGSLVPTANAVADIGSPTNYFNRVYAVSTSAVYSDLAEMYTADAAYPPGTVLSFGGSAEVTESHVDADERVAGIVSTAPSYLMNSNLSGDNVVALALVGRVPTRVTGAVRKGDMMVSNGDGRARAEHAPRIGTVIGKALANFNGADGMIEVVVGRL